MFDRECESYHDAQSISENDLERFNNDEYLTKYLVSCFNPEYKVRVTFPKSEPRLAQRSGGISFCREIKIDSAKGVF